MLELEPGGALERDDLVEVLHAENVLARRYFYPGCHRLEPYRSAGLSMPLTERVAAGVVVLPTGTAVDESDIERVCSLIRTAAAGGREVGRRLKGARFARSEC